MAHDYAGDVTFALDMIAEFGRLVTFHQLSEAPADPTKPLEGVQAGGWQLVSQWAAYDLANASSASFATLNNRIVLDKSLFQAGSKLRLSFDGAVDGSPGADGAALSAVVGLAASGGNPWDYASAPVAVTFSSQSTVDLTGALVGSDANRYVSDPIDLAIDGASDVVVSFTYVSGVIGGSQATVAVPPDTWHQYLNAGAGAIDDIAPGGLLDTRSLLGDNQQWGLSKVEVLVSAGVDVPGVFACFVEPAGLKSLGISTKQNGLWKDSAQIALVGSDGINDLTTFDTITDSDGSTWKIDHTEKFRPGDTTLLYFVGVKR